MPQPGTHLSSQNDLKIEWNYTKAKLSGREKLTEQLNKQLDQLNERTRGYRVEHAMHDVPDC
jgi:hypothetical protein